MPVDACATLSLCRITSYNVCYTKLLRHLYFLEKSGEVFLRAHESARYSDIVKRYTFLKAKEMQSPFYGIEFGIKKNYTLRVVHPWVVDGEVIGYLELGKEIDKLMEALASQMNIEIVITSYSIHYTKLYDGFVLFLSFIIFLYIKNKKSRLIIMAFLIPQLS